MLILLGFFLGSVFGVFTVSLCFAAREKNQEISVQSSSARSSEGAVAMSAISPAGKVVAFYLRPTL